MKIVTHIRPHLDEACAIWLLRRYLVEARDAAVEFVPTSTPFDQDPQTLMIGVGRGPLDEHKGDIGECAASLTFNYLHDKKLIPDDDFAAVQRIVDWVRLEDTGQLQKIERREFTVPVIFENHFIISGKDSSAILKLSEPILEALLAAQRNLIQVEADWSKRTEFASVFGPAVGLKSDIGGIEAYANQQGFNLVVWVNAARNYHNIRATAASPIDLTPIYNKLKEVDKQADWFLHHSKKLLICGSELDPHSQPSKVTLEWLIELLTPNYVRQRRHRGS